MLLWQSIGSLVVCLGASFGGYWLLGWARNRDWNRRHGIFPAE